MSRDYYLIKKDSEKRVLFPATESREGLLVSPQGHPMVIGDEINAAGFKAADVQVPIADLSPAILPLVLRVGNNRGHLVERRETPAERRAREKEEHNRENVFLRERGYHWEKSSFYCSGDIGDFVEYFALIDPTGNEVIGKRDGGGRVEAFGYLKGLLLQLGYYGQEAIDKADAKNRFERREMRERSEMRERVDAYFADTSNRIGEPCADAKVEFTTRPISIEKHYPRRQFRIESDCIWLETHNSSDGDDWSLNNSDYGIARQYKFDAEIAECLRTLTS